MTNERPREKEYAPFYQGYISLVPDGNIVEVLRDQAAELERVAASVPKDRESYRYGPDKWSVREVFGHMGDGERVFGYRVFCIGRGEQASLPGFDEKAYIAQSGYDHRPLAELTADLIAARKSNLRLLSSLDETAWGRLGVANGSPVSVRALAFIMAGHVRHHLAVLTERYRV